MKNIYGKRFFLLFFVIVPLCLSAPAGRAEAYVDDLFDLLFGDGTLDPTIRVTNQTKSTVYFAIVYEDYKAREWTARGWWNIGAHQTISIDIPTYNSNLYYYAESDIESWEGSGNNDRDKTYIAVFDNAFNYNVYSEWPEGKNRRDVSFIRITLSGDIDTLSLWGN